MRTGETQVNTNTEIKTLEAAIEEAYPIPDSPHTSVLMRAADQQVAFTRGWAARDAEIARLQAALAEQDAQLSKKPCQYARCVEHNRLTAALADRDAKQVQGELPPLPDAWIEMAGLYNADQMQAYARAAIAQRVGCGEPVDDGWQEFFKSLDAEDKMFEQIDRWARESYRRHKSSCRGQQITSADSENAHVIWAALRWAKETTPPAAVTDADKRDAELWRAFIGSARIRPQGSAGLESGTDPNGNQYDGYAHMGLEIWTKYDRNFSPELLAKMDKDTELGRRWLTSYAAIAASEQANKREGV